MYKARHSLSSVKSAFELISALIIGTLVIAAYSVFLYYDLQDAIIITLLGIYFALLTFCLSKELFITAALVFIIYPIVCLVTYAHFSFLQHG